MPGKLDKQKLQLLVVEDDPNLGQILTEYLQIKGYHADLARDGVEGTKLFFDNKYDLCILDIMLPKKDGFTLAKEIRASKKNIPFLFLTAKSLKEDTLEGFKIGADDYVTKPFSMEELILRLNVILRRNHAKQEEKESPVRFGKFTFDYTQQELSQKGKNIHLTSKECELLRLLYLHKNKILERKLALNMIWRDDSYFNARSMDVYIAKLRKYLKSDESLQIITIHGQGFRFVDSN